MPAPQLAAFSVRVDPGPAASPGPAPIVVVTPSGARSFYCLEAGAVTRPGSVPGPVGQDYCDSALGPALLGSRDSGRSAYLPYGSGAPSNLAIGTPIYEGDFRPDTVAGRRAAFLGWTGAQISPVVLLDDALIGHPQTHLALRFGTGPHAATFAAGRAPAGSQTDTADLHNGWYVLTSSRITSSAIMANDNALFLLLGGTVISLLLALLFFGLGAGRARAVWQVRRSTAELEHQSFHDALTGLPNQALILDRLGQMMARSVHDDSSVAALFLGLDNFKDVNDSLGHAAGDELLSLVGKRLVSILGDGHSVGRFGGDEFVVLVEGRTVSARPELVAERILDVLAEPFEIGSVTAKVTIGASIGIAEGSRHNPDDLLRDADIALNRAKASGRRNVVVFASPMHDAVDARRMLEADLREAVVSQQFFVLYQPTVDIRTGRVTGAEALVRWRHPSRGVVGPAQFIPALEATGLIVEVGRWVIVQACRQGASWQRAGHRLTVSVNISARQLEGESLVEDVRAALEATGFAPGPAGAGADRDDPDAGRPVHR